VERRRKSTEHRHTTVEGISGESLVTEDGDQISSIEGSFDTMGPIKARARDVRFGYLRELMHHYRLAHRLISCIVCRRDFAPEIDTMKCSVALDKSYLEKALDLAIGSCSRAANMKGQNPLIREIHEKDMRLFVDAKASIEEIKVK